VKVNTPNDKEKWARRRIGKYKVQAHKREIDSPQCLIPKQDVAGGRKLPFGVTDTTQTNKKEK
jgi:hypothetical protein